MIEPEDKVAIEGSKDAFTVIQYVGQLNKFLISEDSNPENRMWVTPEQLTLVAKGDPFGNGWPRLVYHYTSLDTMMKIVDKGQIWATSTNYLNDTQEREEFLEGIRNRLPHFEAAHADYDPTFSSVLKHHRLLNYLPFVACFSRESDSLYQWRAYCPSAQGVCIGFRVAALMKATLDTTSTMPTPSETPKAIADIHFQQIYYLPTDNPEYIDAALEKYWTETRRRSSDAKSDSELKRIASSDFIQRLERTAALYKNEAFSLEREFRLLVPSVHLDLSVVRARQTKSSLAPYLVLDVPSVSGTVTRRLMKEAVDNSQIHRWDAIERIVIGPTIDKRLTKEAVETYLSSRGVQANVDVTRVPFRDW